MINPTSPKVIAAAAGGGVATVAANVILWVIGVVAYGVPADAAHADLAMAAVPGVLSASILFVLVLVGAYLPGYQITDPQRHPELSSSVVAYQTGSGLVVAGPALTGTPVDVTVNPNVGIPDDTTEADVTDNVDLPVPPNFDDGSAPVPPEPVK